MLSHIGNSPSHHFKLEEEEEEKEEGEENDDDDEDDTVTKLNVSYVPTIIATDMMRPCDAISIINASNLDNGYWKAVSLNIR